MSTAVQHFNMTIFFQIFNTFILILLVTIPFAFLEIYLAKKPNKWLGLILPILSFTKASIATFFIVLNLYTFNMFANTHNTARIHSSIEPSPMFNASPILVGIVVFVLLNIPTLIYFIIYNIFHKKIQNRVEIDKMRIRDL